jgi:uncharacterized protein YndB with AHSA1/START domain
METADKTAITVEVSIHAPITKVWKLWTSPEHITKWYYASDDWHAPYAENDLRKDGSFKTTMAAKDGSFSFDFAGVYTQVSENQFIDYVLGDGRKVHTAFSEQDNETRVVQTFEAESANSQEVQRGGWQAILNNFKKYAETN